MKSINCLWTFVTKILLLRNLPHYAKWFCSITKPFFTASEVCHRKNIKRTESVNQFLTSSKEKGSRLNSWENIYWSDFDQSGAKNLSTQQLVLKFRRNCNKLSNQKNNNNINTVQGFTMNWIHFTRLPHWLIGQELEVFSVSLRFIFTYKSKHLLLFTCSLFLIRAELSCKL